jgi:hypothetical protein
MDPAVVIVGNGGERGELFEGARAGRRERGGAPA